MWKLIDRFFDDIAKKLAENLCSNLELVEQNREEDKTSKVAKSSIRHPPSSPSYSIHKEHLPPSQYSSVLVCDKATFIA